MEMQKTLKTVLMTATLCALAGLANSASAASCSENDGNCQSPSVNAGSDRRVSFRCTIDVPFGLDLGNCKVVEVASGRAEQNFNFRGDTGTRLLSVQTTGAYRCVVEHNGPDLNGHKVYCRID